MEVLRKPAGMYLVGVATVVAVFFIINPFLVDSLDVPLIWTILDILMVIALVPALLFNYMCKRGEDGQDSGGSVTRRYLEVNVAFYLTAAVTILFLHNWFSQLSEGLQSPAASNHPAWIIWAVVDTMLPLVIGATGCRMLCGGGKD